MRFVVPIRCRPLSSTYKGFPKSQARREINFKIRFAGGLIDLARARMQEGGHISLRAMAKFGEAPLRAGHLHVRPMSSDRDDLAAQFQLLSDEELMSRGTSGGLTALAQSVAMAEARVRGLFLPEPVPMDEAMEADGPYHGDMKIVARYLTPTEAHMLCSCLQAAGVPAEAGDTNLVQTHSLLAGAVGGACLRVPEQFVPEATEVIAAFNRGDFALGEDFDFDA